MVSLKMIARLGLLWASLAVLPAVVQAQFFYSNNGDGTCTITQYIGGGGNVTIPDTISNLWVTSIGGTAFYECNSLTSVTIPESVTSIGIAAFWHCAHLTSVTIPDSVTHIKNEVFYGCNGLTNVMMPNSLTHIGSVAFRGCIGLTSVTIPSGVTNIEYGAFYECSSMTSVFFIGNAPNLGSLAFGGSPTIVYYLPGTMGWDTFGYSPTVL